MTTRRYDLRAWQSANRAAKEKGAADPAAPAAAKPASALSVLRPLTPRQVAARLAALRCDPLAIMAKLAKNPHLDPNLRVALARHLAAYQIEQTPLTDGDKALPALGDVIAAAWRRPKAAGQFTAQSKAKSAAAYRKRKTPKP
jgi:hypothetical protein